MDKRSGEQSPKAELKLDSIGTWSQAKHAVIARYVAAYAQILGNQGYLKFHYIDGFCGAGESTSKDTGAILKGSPLHALGTESPFTSYYFIDSDKGKTEHLRQICDEKYPNREIHIKTGDSNKIIKEILPKFSYKGYDRILCLLDPYGLHLAWDVIVQLGHLGKSGGKGIVDIMINFPIMDINRNYAPRNPSAVPKEAQRMDTFWGDDSWRTSLYKERGLLNLPEKVDYENLVNAYCERLKKKAGFKFVPKPVKFTNTINAPIFYFCFASHNRTASKVATHLYKKTGDSLANQRRRR